MKKLLIILVLFLLVGVSSNAQIRHIKGLKAVGASFGMTKFGIYTGADFSMYFARNLYLKAGGFWEKGEDAGIDFNTITLDAGAYFTLVDFGEVVFLNVSGGLTASFDSINGQDELQIPDEFKYGAWVGGEVEIFITNRIVGLINGSQRFMFKENYGKQRAYYGIGVKYNL